MTLSPIHSSSRLQSIDVLRGVAVLGILLMNIRMFGNPNATYFNPTAYGDFSGLNQLAYWLTTVFADQKFMTIFSMLFGAGIALMGERAEAKGLSPAWLLYRRNFWLLVLGAVHAYLLWHGDILVIYSLCGFIVILFRRRKPATQFTLGLIMLMIASALSVSAGLSFGQWPQDQVQKSLEDWAPGAETIARELAIYQGNWIGQLEHRVPKAIEFHTFIFGFWGFWRAGGLMLIGMALFRWGVFSASLDRSRYSRLAIAGLLLGIPAVIYGTWLNFAGGWHYASSFFLNAQFNYWASVFISLAYVSLVMLWCKGGQLAALRERLAAVGRMAFSNYIAQTVICTLVFYGNGLGLFGQLQLWQMLLVVIGVWVVLLLISPWWLARFHFGPLEWLWRSLTYWKLQPLKRST